MCSLYITAAVAYVSRYRNSFPDMACVVRVPPPSPLSLPVLCQQSDLWINLIIFWSHFVKPNWLFDKLIVCLINNLSESVDRRYWYPEDPPVPICALPSIRWTRITWLSTRPVFNSLAHLYFKNQNWQH